METYCGNTNSYLTCDWYLTILYLSLVIMVDIIKKPSTIANDTAIALNNSEDKKFNINNHYVTMMRGSFDRKLFITYNISETSNIYGQIFYLPVI